MVRTQHSHENKWTVNKSLLVYDGSNSLVRAAVETATYSRH